MARAAAKPKTKLERDAALDLLRTMWRVRVFEERVGQLKRADEVHGLIHLSLGQESVAAGVCTQLRDDDNVYSGHRAHGHALAKGAPMDRVMAELMGRKDGLCHGLGGSMHLVDTEHGLMGATGVVGGNIPIALGTALASHLDEGDAVTVVFFGDGAVQAGHFNETVNLATLWGLPLILVCENNGFAEFTPRSAHTNVERVSDVVAPYELTRETVDGNDVAEVREAFGRFLAAARKDEGPLLLECLTHRLSGHYVGDPAQYREALADEEWQQKDEGPLLLECLTHRLSGHYVGDPAQYREALADEEWQQKDPIQRFQRAAAEAGWLDDQIAATVEAEARQEVEAAVEFGRASPFPEPDVAMGLVYAPAAAAPDLSPGPGGAQTTFVKALNATLAEAMRADADVLVIGEDVTEGGPYTVTAGLAEEFGTERVINTPISEAAICGVSIGAAQSGKRPVLEIMFIDFLTLALDQLVNAAAKAHFMSGGQLRVPLVLRTQGGAGSRGAAQHSQSLEAWVTHIPGLKVVMPSNAADAAGLLISSLADPNPVVFIEHKNLYFRKEEMPDEIEAVPIGSARVAREGRDVTIVALSRLVGEALDAADRLAAEGVEAEVIDPRTLVPLDLEAIADSVKRTNRLVVAHEAVERGGFGAEIAASLQSAAFDHLDAPIERVGAPFEPVPLSPPVEDAYLPGADEIYAAARATLGHESSG